MTNTNTDRTCLRHRKIALKEAAVKGARKFV